MVSGTAERAMATLNEKDSTYHKLLALENVLSTLKGQKTILVKNSISCTCALRIVQLVV